MAGTTVSTVVEAPAAQVWALVRDFHALNTWHPGVLPGRLGNDLSGNTIGSVRVFDLDGEVLRETLVAFDEEARSYTYSLPDGTFELYRYRATLRVVPVTELSASFVEWSADYDVEAAHHGPATDRVHRVFTSGLTALRGHFAR